MAVADFGCTEKLGVADNHLNSHVSDSIMYAST